MRRDPIYRVPVSTRVERAEREGDPIYRPPASTRVKRAEREWRRDPIYRVPGVGRWGNARTKNKPAYRYQQLAPYGPNTRTVAGRSNSVYSGERGYTFA